MSVDGSRTIATWPSQKMRSPRCKLERSAAGSTIGRNDCSCMSLSRQQGAPQALNESCTSAEQSRPRAGLAAPQIGRAEEALCDADEITFLMMRLDKVPKRHEFIRGGDGKRRLDARNRQLAAKRKRFDRRNLDRRRREHQRAHDRDAMGGLRADVTQCFRRQPADIAVGLQLPPGPAFLVGVVDGDELAFERLGVRAARRVGVRAAPALAAPRPCAACPRHSGRP